MDTSRLKKFATEARANLIKGVVDRLKTLGFDENGNVKDSDRPEPLQGGALFRGELKQGDGFYKKWIALENAIKHFPHGAKAGVKQVAEEAAYTWFNRFVAIRILQKNRLIEPQLAYADGGKIPMIVENARSGRLPTLTSDEKLEWDNLSEDDSKVHEQFALLIVAYCHTTPILTKCFGHIDDYTELLLPHNILADGGFIDLLNTTDYISEDDFKRTELIGWLYQFYISEKKDEVFASFKNKKKAEAEDIPAATQIFTPNWIVKYMVQNTLGRIYLDNNKGSDLAKDWKYLVDNDGNSGEIYKYANLESLRVADFASGSGHILNEFFDMLYSFYDEDAYDSKEAIECIFTKNLVGIDLDTRAKQLSMFSLLLKACQKNKKFVDARVLPRVFDMPEIRMDAETTARVRKFIEPTDSKLIVDQIIEAMKLMESAKNLGSTMKFEFKVEGQVRATLMDALVHAQECEDLLSMEIAKAFELILVLTDKYSAISMNPPYMGNANMNAELSGYVKDNYPNSKADLFSVFMDVCIDRLENNAKYGMINMHSWMFLSSFENLRTDLLKNYLVDNMLHLGPRTFDELGGEVVQNSAYVVTKAKRIDATGTYFRLVEGKDCSSKEQMFLDSKTAKDINDKIYYPNVPQSNFAKIPGSPIGYWVSDAFVENYNGKYLSNDVHSFQGLITGDNSKFLRLWSEIDAKCLKTGYTSYNEAFGKKSWVPYLKGGAFRRWYGNKEFVLRWLGNGNVYTRSRIENKSYYFNEGVSWSFLTSGKFNARLCEVGSLWDVAGSSLFPFDSSHTNNVLAFVNSVVVNEILELTNPTINFQVENILALPVVSGEMLENSNIQDLAKQNVLISKTDWDAHETSWDFQTNELLAVDSDVPHSLASRMAAYENKWHEAFFKLHSNEEELNRLFIEIYGLQDELTPDVPLDEVTILQQGEISVGKHATCNMSCNDPLVDYNDIEFNRDVIIKQFISYAVGCMMGRYRLDKPGLAIAHPNATAEEKAPYQYNGETFAMDDDGIIPLMSKDSAFSDNAVNRFTEFLRVTLGAESLTDNLNYVETCLGKTVEDYLVKNFWTDHKKMYQNRPIYWMFSSKKGAFKCITYMHRMDAYTAELVRKNYLLKHIDYLANKIAGLEQDEANLSSGDRKKLANYRKDYDECIEYDGRLQLVAAKQIAFDLDDGVVVNYAKFGDVLAKLK